eukprot:CAMPEP_0184497656 /NCGR_PEP_ID=MMETSP0113_2-20130426/37151_1 /TAXON_ID=91329 /ORGANISM="Norrisiella sphaerica, Strain BC52" /LENGTH=252 /DNA_ID=CAMNT_0026884867 /DNA_START=252 /DNA_END=1007 /DNA_ORIENTATION=-
MSSGSPQQNEGDERVPRTNASQRKLWSPAGDRNESDAGAKESQTGSRPRATNRNVKILRRAPRKKRGGERLKSQPVDQKTADQRAKEYEEMKAAIWAGREVDTKVEDTDANPNKNQAPAILQNLIPTASPNGNGGGKGGGKRYQQTSRQYFNQNNSSHYSGGGPVTGPYAMHQGGYGNHNYAQSNGLGPHLAHTAGGNGAVSFGAGDSRQQFWQSDGNQYTPYGQSQLNSRGSVGEDVSLRHGMEALNLRGS